MSIRRVFLGWQQPALVSAAHFLREQFPPDDLAASVPEWNLEQVTIVVPGGRAGRKLLEVLVGLAEQQQWALIPPEIETVGRLPEQLYRPQRPFASDLVQQLAWVQALRKIEAATIAEVFPQLESADDGGRDGDLDAERLELSRLLQRLHFELAADGLSFGEVATRLGGAPGREARRWRALADIQRAYLLELDHLQLWDRQTARLVAIEKRECGNDRYLLLLGVADLNVAVRQMLDQVNQVTALIFAPEELAERFDEHGCLIADQWQHAAVRLPDEQLRTADGPGDQAGLVVELVAEHARQHPPNDIVIGVPDESLVPTLKRHLEDAGAKARWGVGRPVMESGPARLLSAVADYVDSPTYPEFAALIRHPDVFRWLSVSGANGNVIAASDDHYMRHLQSSMADWQNSLDADSALALARTQIAELLGPDLAQAKPIAEWPQVVSDLLATVYGDRTLATQDELDHEYIQVLRTLRTELAEMVDVPPELEIRLHLDQYLQLLFSSLAARFVTPPQEAASLELLGWLELPLDLAPALIVTTFNEGKVPSSSNSDLFLPNSLRQRLGLLDNHRRFARDAYAVQTLVASRRVDFIVARRDQEGEPLVPSRLALADEPEVVARRVLRFLRSEEDQPAATPAVAKEVVAVPKKKMVSREPTSFVVPMPGTFEVPTQLAVTALSSYLTCPYRFYLRHVLKLEAADDRAEEMDALAFGSLAHEVLNDFGRGPYVHSTDAEEILAFLEHALETRATENFGTRRLPALQVQLGQLRFRLAAFAEWQADWAAQGWRIVHVEQSCNWQVTTSNGQPLVVDGKKLTLRGRIDRIDRRHEEWVVFDYKTSDRGPAPEETHYGTRVVDGEKIKGWIDLQLPVYRHLVTSLGVPKTAWLGYINLPKDVTAVGEELATWDDAKLLTADETVVEVATRILSGQYWPPAELSPNAFDDYRWLCQGQALDRVLQSST